MGETWREVAVEVPTIICPLGEAQFNHLSSVQSSQFSYNPLTTASCHGIDLNYIRTLQIFENMTG